jgi:DNA sulfur modification protein DndC
MQETTIKIVRHVETIQEKMERAINVILGLIRKKYSLCGATSSGKDSSVVALLMLEAIRRAKELGLHQVPHLVMTAHTGVENPAISFHCEDFLEDIRRYCEHQGLDVTVHTVEPSLASQFVVTTCGRGTLIRTPQSTAKKANGMGGRSCSVDWKLEPQRRLRSRLSKDMAAQGYGEILTLIGTRFEESESRSRAMHDRGESETNPIRDKEGHLSLSPIATWNTDDVWEAIALFMDESTAPYPPIAPARTFQRLHQIYVDANEGTCTIVLGEGGNRSACGSRTGCAVCTVSGDKDKSMESMIKEPQYAHLAGLNRFRNLLLENQWDLSKRELVGRTISDAGYIRISADTYSYAYRIQLLRYMLTLDALEADRAEKHEADYVTGRIPRTPENEELCSPFFEFVTPAKLLAIDFQLSMHHFCDGAFPAVREWYMIKVLGKRYHMPPPKAPVPKPVIPIHGWYKVGSFDAEVPAWGLYSFEAERWNPYRHPNRISAYAKSTQGDRMVYFEESDQMEVDPIEANLFVTCTFNMEMYQQAQMMDSLESARFWLNEGILKLPEGMSAKYQNMALRGQYFKHLAQKLNCTPAELDRYLMQKGISDAQHNLLVNSTSIEDLPLFAGLGPSANRTDEDAFEDEQMSVEEMFA